MLQRFHAQACLKSDAKGFVISAAQPGMRSLRLASANMLSAAAYAITCYTVLDVLKPLPFLSAAMLTSPRRGAAALSRRSRGP